MPRLLFTDTETTGVPARGCDQFDHPNLPRIVQLACVLLDHDGAERAAVSLVIRPDVDIPVGASNVHGITMDIAADFGVAEKAAAGMFLRLCQKADIVVAHNAPFDLLMLRGAVHRAGASWIEKPVRCTMTAATPILMMPPTARMVAAGFNKPKPPKLEEAFEHLMGRKMENAHNAMADVLACVAVYRKLEALGVFKEAA